LSAAESSSLPVRLITWNVRSLRDDRDAVVATLQRLRADVVPLQETPRLWFPQRAVRRLASRAGLRVAAGGAAGHGSAVLVGPGTQVVTSVLTPLTRSRGRHRRALASAVLQLRGTPVLVASGHLGLSGAERLRHVAQIHALLARFAVGPTTLVGLDTNEAPGGRVTQALGSGGRLVEVLSDRLDAAPTFPASAPVQRIDQLWVSPDVEVRQVGVPDLPRLADASDHLPVVADLALSRPGGQPAGWGATR
jgi:endonuclease/exonuclease/phosphatase family metal-dependent hydrolase